MTTWILITIACACFAFSWLIGLLCRWCSMRAFLVVLAGFSVQFVLLMIAAARAELNVSKPTLLQLSPANPSVGELTVAPDSLGEFTTEYARLNGVDCPVYLRNNGTYFAVAGGERVDVDRVAGHARRDGVVKPYYRTRRDGVATNNLSADLHGGGEREK